MTVRSPSLMTPACRAAADGRFEQLVGALLFLDVNRHHAPGQIHLPQHLFVRRAADDGDERAELGDHPPRHSRFADGDDRGGVQVVRCGAGRMGDGVGHVAQFGDLRLREALSVIDVPLGAFGDARHRAHGLDRIGACGRLARQHNGRGAVVNGVGDVGGLRRASAADF